MKILVVDDNLAMAEQLGAMCENYCKRQHIEAETRWAVRFEIPEGNTDFEHPDILVLDIEMPGMNGLEIRDYYDRKHLEEPDLRKEGPYIIFVSSHVDLMVKTFGPNVIAFLPKPVPQSSMDEVLTTAMRYVQRDDVISLGEGKKVALGRLIYIEADHMYTDVITADEKKKISIRRSLTEWESLLPAGTFLRISNSCIVNCKWIKTLTGIEVILKEGRGQLAISRRRKKECIEAFNDYCERMQRYVK